MNKTITDLRCSFPETAWTEEDSNAFTPVSKPSSAKWRIVDYECETHSGKMLWGHGDDAAVLSIPLNAKGWHAIHILVGYADLDVRLSGNANWQNIKAFPPKESNSTWSESGMWGRPLIWEPVRFADLTDKSLEIRVPPADLEHRKHDTSPAAAIWGLRISELPQKHVDVIKTKEKRRLIYINDGFSLFFHAQEPGCRTLDHEMEAFWQPAWHTCCFGIGQRGYPNYPSKLVDPVAEKGWAFVRNGEQRYKENIHTTIKSGENPLQYTIDKAHENQQKHWTYFRPQLWTMSLPFDHAFRSKFYSEHPQCRCLEADGQTISKMSIAFPEVRQHFADFFQEALEHGTDGIGLAFIRGYPLVRYEEPVQKRVKEKLGLNALELEENDPRLQSIWSDFVTEWLCEIRKQIDAFSGPSRKIELVVFVPSIEKCRLFGNDIRVWAKQEVVDVIIPSSEISLFKEMINGTKTQLIPSIGGDDKTTHSLRSKANELYAQGVDGLTCWDTPKCFANLELERPQRQKLWHDFYMQDRCVELISLSGDRLKPFNPALGG